MFIFNTTFLVAHSKFKNWEEWLRNSYIPILQNQVPASEVNVYEVMSADNNDGKTISVQWKVATPNDLETINKQTPLVIGQMQSDFGEDVLYFSSILKAL